MQTFDPISFILIMDDSSFLFHFDASCYRITPVESGNKGLFYCVHTFNKINGTSLQYIAGISLFHSRDKNDYLEISLTAH